MLLSEKDVSAGDKSIQSVRQVTPPSNTSSTSSIFAACSPSRSVSGGHGDFDDSCSDFMHILYDENNSASQRSIQMPTDDAYTMSQICDSSSPMNAATGGRPASAGERGQWMANEPKQRATDGDDEADSDDELINAVRNVLHEKMVRDRISMVTCVLS